MIRRLIFDLDNTLINWEDTYYPFAVKNACTDLHLNNYSDILNIVISSIDNYENVFDHFSIKNMANLLSQNASDYLNIHFTKEFVEKLIYYFSLCVPKKIDSSLIETLDYLYRKYDLVVLTNWFEEPQIKRLRKINILKYFSHVYGTEKIKNKPNKEAFDKAIENFNPEECVMIGDNLMTDIKGALDNNINAIFYNRKNICVPEEYSSQNLQCISSIIELKTLL